MSTVEQIALPLPDLPGLGEGWEMLLPAEQRARRCTGSTAAALEEKREAIVGACVHLGTRRVAQAFGVSREVVRALRAEAIRSGKLDQLKEEAGRRALSVADRILDRIEDEVDELPRASLAVTYGIVKDKGLLLVGAPTQRVEHVTGPQHADLNSMIDALPVAVPVSAGETAGQKAPLELEAGAQALEVIGEIQAPAGRASDTQTLAFRPSLEGSGATWAKDGQNGPETEATT